MSEKEVLQTGRYRHYKGGEYQVYGVARHSESEQALVVYRPLYGDGDLWVRPLDMFVEEVVTETGKVARFSLIEVNTASLDADI